MLKRTAQRSYSYIGRACIAGLFLFLAWVSAWPQISEKDSLQLKKSEIENEIEFTTKLLEETRATKQASMNELAMISSKISKREELIQTITAEIAVLNRQLSSNQTASDQLDRELTALKDEYARMIYLAFKNRNAYDRLLFIFSARSFNQAYQRMKYMQQYNEYRRQQARLITAKQEELDERKREIERQRTEKESLLIAKEREIIRLDQEKSGKDQAVSMLGQKENELRKALREKEQAARRLQKAIEEIIAEEIRKSLAAADRADAAETVFALTPEERELSNTFAANIGKLPWPTERGVISGIFGEQPHPVLKGIRVKNNGIDILTNTGSIARAVFDGEVTRVINVPRYNNVVIIRHGEFLSVYSNLSQVYVVKDDKVSTKQTIGLIYTDEEKARTELHFELWRGKELLDPRLWIAR